MSWDTPADGGWDKPKEGAQEVDWNTGGAKDVDWNAGATSKDVANGELGGGGGHGDGAPGGGCRNCGQEGHFARECPEPRKDGGGGCFNCGEEGHSKADCPNPRVFKGTCRICNQEGHSAAQCPEKPPDICRNCKQEGHKVTECTENRVIDDSAIETKTAEAAWDGLKAADRERDLDEFREALKIYHKAEPSADWQSLERAFRTQDCNVYLIGYEKEVTDTYTLMDLNGKLDRKYHVGFYFSEKAPRGKMKESWPKSPEENMERLANAGLPVERGIPKCTNCNELGHIAKSCKEEKVERNLDTMPRNVLNPVLPKALSARTVPKVSDAKPFINFADIPALVGHFAKDCPDRKPETCDNCGQEGHRRRDCTEPRKMICRNCDEEGHQSRECPKPRDWSRVKCTRCGEMGHTQVRCKMPEPEPEAGDGGYGENAGGGASGYDNYNSGSLGAGAAGNAGATTAVGGGDSGGW
ncbi:hypothetical protein MMC10_007898 [Thelotrema lepadinum]|nr:hypothetical protein [Thelotrema lepadinum]